MAEDITPLLNILSNPKTGDKYKVWFGLIGKDRQKEIIDILKDYNCRIGFDDGVWFDSLYIKKSNHEGRLYVDYMGGYIHPPDDTLLKHDKSYFDHVVGYEELYAEWFI